MSTTDTQPEDDTRSRAQNAAPSRAQNAARLRARIQVFPRREILDPQGKAIGEALVRLGFSEVAAVRAGKSFDIEIEASSEQAARDRLQEMCRKLLANPITEDFSVQLLEEA